MGLLPGRSLLTPVPLPQPSCRRRCGGRGWPCPRQMVGCRRPHPATCCASRRRRTAWRASSGTCGATSRPCGPSCTSCSSTRPCWARPRAPRSVPAQRGAREGGGRPRLGAGSQCPSPLLVGSHLPGWSLGKDAPVPAPQGTPPGPEGQVSEGQLRALSCHLGGPECWCQAGTPRPVLSLTPPPPASGWAFFLLVGRPPVLPWPVLMGSCLLPGGRARVPGWPARAGPGLRVA